MKEYDVIVVGAGNAAFCSALAAQEQGASVLVVEAAPEDEAGGNSRFTAGNLARNSQRAERRYRQFLAKLPREAMTPDAADAALDGFALSVDTELRAALSTLSQTELHLFCLVALEDCALADAARVLGLSPPAAKARYHRTRHRLRDHLDPQLTAGGAQ